MTGPRAMPALLTAAVAVNGMVGGATLDQASGLAVAGRVQRLPLLAAGIGTVGQGLVTACPAPQNFSQRPGSAVTATEIAGAQR